MASIDTILKISVQGTDQMVRLKTEIDATSVELKQLQKDAKKAGASQTEFNAKIITAETKLKGLRGELNKSKTDLIKNAKAAGDASKSYDSLTKQNAALSAQLRKLADPLGKNNKEFTKLSQKIRTNTDQLKKMDAQMGRNQRNVGNYKQAIGSVVTVVGAAIIAFRTFQRVLGTFVEFEFQMKQVGVISGATADELNVLTESAKELGATTAFTAGEVAGLQKELAKLGFNPEEIESMTTATLDLAFAFGNELAETGEVVGIVMNSYKLEAQDATRVTDVLAKAFSSTALDLQKFNVAFPKVGAISKQLGFSLEGTTAILGELTNAGLEASTAGTSLKNIFLKLADSNSELSQKLGGNVNSIDELLPALNQLFLDGTDVEEMLGLTDKRAVTAFATMVAGAGDVQILTEELKDSAGTAAEFSEVMRDSLKGSIDEATSAANGFVIELFDKLAPAITFVVDAVGALFNGFSLIIDNIGKVAIAIGVYSASGIIAAGVTAGWSTALAGSSIAMGIYSIATKFAEKATKRFTAAIAANPIGLLAAGLALAISLLWTFGEASDEAADAEADLNEEIDDTIKSTEKLAAIRKKNEKQELKEIANLRVLKKAVKDNVLSTKERGKALAEFNKKAGTNISNLQTEKQIVEQLESAYNRAVGAIKRKLIIQATQEQVTELLKEQIAIEKEIANAKDAAATATKNIVDEEKNLSVEQKKRQNFSADAIKLAQKQVLAENDINDIKAEGAAEQFAQNVKLRDQRIETFTEQLTHGQQLISLSGTQANATKEVIQAQANIVTEQFKINKATEEYNEKQEDVAELASRVNAVYQEGERTLQGLGKTTGETSEKTDDLKTEYQLLQEAVKEADKALKNAVIAQDIFETAAATENLTKAKREMKFVDDKIAEQYGVINAELNTYIESLKKKQEEGEKTIANDKLQLAALEKLEDADASFAEERIRLALKIAQSELDLALSTAAASDLSTGVQIANMKLLKEKIEQYQAELNEVDPDGGGFMKKILFGSDAEGNAFTGEDLINNVGMTLELVSDVLGEFNALQQERLNNQLSVVQKTSDAEVKAFEESAEFEVLTDEERTERIEAIQAKHDAKMLQLKIDQFKKDQKLGIAQAIINGGLAIMRIAAETPKADFGIMTAILIGAQALMTAIQVATIASQQPPTAARGGIMDESFFAKGGMVHGKSHAQGGEKFSVGGRVAELEGGEAVINKRSTAMFKPILSNMNVAGGGKKFADGGMVFNSDAMSNESEIFETLVGALNSQQVLLVESDVTNSQRSVKNIESKISF